MHKKIREHINDIYIKDNLFDDLGSIKLRNSLFLVIENRLFSLLYNIILFEFNISGKKEINKYIDYVFTSSGISYLYSKYKCLELGINTELDQSLSFLQKFVDRLDKDIQPIGLELFGINDLSINSLTNIDFHLSDRHSGSETVIVLEFSSKYKFLYKPRSLGIDILYKKIAKIINKELNKDVFYIVDSLNLGDYGWQKFIERVDCNSEEDIKEYYSRLGYSLSLIYLLGGTDYHNENIIPHGSYPVLVDLETLIQGERIDIKQKKDNIEDFLRFANLCFSSSIYKTGIVPYIEDNGIDSSAIGFDLQSKIPSFEIKYLSGKYRQSRVYKPNDEFSSSPTLNGRKINIIGNFEHFFNGFKDSYYKIADIIELKILPFLENYNVELRYVYRATQYYVDVISGANHPENLLNIDKRINFFLKYLNSSIVKNDYFSKLELKDLWNGNIPKFTFKLCSINLYIGEEKTKFSFKNTTLEYLKENLNNLTNLDLLLRELQNSYNIACYNNSINSSFFKDFGKYRIMKNDNFDHKIKKIYRTIIENSIEKDDYILFSSTIAGGKKLSYSLIGGNLYDGLLGISLFFSSYSLYKSDNKSKLLAYKSYYTGRNLLLKNIQDQSLYSGILGIVYTGIIISELFNDIKLQESVFDDFEKYISIPRKNKELDIISGISGKLIVAINLYRIKKTKKLELYIDKCIYIIIRNYIQYGCNNSNSPKSFIHTGFAHGISGVIYALQKYLKYIKKDKKIKNIISKLIIEEDQFYDKEIGNWDNNRRKNEKQQYSWCYGAPGILLTRNISNYNFDIRNFVNSNISDSLCHGNFGNLEIIKELKIDSNIGDNLKNRNYISGLPNNVFDIGFMTGISGIGYNLIKMFGNIDLPSVLLIDIINNNNNL